MKKLRADALLTEQMALENLALARALIMEGRVMAGDTKILSASQMLKEGTILRVKGALDSYVSRGAHKLKRAVEAFGIDLNGAVCIDVGCSTGGFTDVMLRSGAKKVYAVDVGYNVLDYRLRADPRVVCMERTNARFLQPDRFAEAIDFGATDVSFISLKAILPAVLPLIRPEGRFVALIKPQFEAAKEDVGAKGVVRDPEVHERVLKDILAFVPTIGWKVNALSHSPIRGPEGNIEFLMDLCRAENVHYRYQEINVNMMLKCAYDFFLKSSD